MAKDRYGNNRPEPTKANPPRHAMPGDVIVGSSDDLIFRPVVIVGSAEQAALAMARIASVALQDGYDIVQVLSTGGGEGVMIFRRRS